MSNIQLARAQRRQMQKLGEKVDRITQADRKFFERFPHRQHRVRIAGKELPVGSRYAASLRA